jgi:hypothetical protein
MKSFFVYLTFYSLLILSVSMLAYYYLLIRPSLGKLEISLAHTSTEVTALGVQVQALKQTTDQLNARTLSAKSSPLTPIVKFETVDTNSVAAAKLQALNDQIGQTLTKLQPSAPIGGLLDPNALSDSALGFIKITSTTWSTIDVYPTTNLSSTPVGVIKLGNIYPYLQKLPDWYQIRLNTTTTGWVEARLVSETTGL